MIGLELAMWQDEVLAQERKRRQERVTPENEQVKALFEDWEKSYPWEKEAFRMGESRLIGMKEVCAAFEAGYHSEKESHWHYTSKGDKPENFEDVLMFCKNCESATYIKMGHTKNGFWYDDFNGELDDREEVIAWQYLPEPPKETN